MYLQTELTEIDEIKGDKRDKDNKVVVRIALATGIKRGKCKTEKKRTVGTKRGKRYKGGIETDDTAGATGAAGSTDDKDVDG